MNFTEQEVRFLLSDHNPDPSGHQVERADVSRGFAEISFRGSRFATKRTMQSVLEKRARALGSIFTKFQEEQRAKSGHADSLETRIAETQIF